MLAILTGTIQTVNTNCCRCCWGRLYARHRADGDCGGNSALNVDADRAAAMIAGALKADSLIILTTCLASCELD